MMLEKEKQLLEAIRADNCTEVCLLLSQRVSPNAYNNHGWTALCLAATRGHTQIVMLLLKNGADCNKKDKHNRTPLECAVMTGNLAIVGLLLHNGANPNTRLANGCPILSIPVITGRLDIVHILISYDVDINAKDANGYTALDVALIEGHANIGKALQRAKIKDGTAIHPTEKWFIKSISTGNMEEAESFLRMGISPNLRGTNGYPALTLAVTKGALAIVKLLVEYGANLNALDRSLDECTSLKWAVYFGYQSIVEILLENGADYTLVDKSGKLPIDYAREKGHKKIEQMLVDSKLSVAQTSGEKYTFKGAIQQNSEEQPVIFDDFIRQLNSLIGLADVKDDIVRLVNFLKVQQMRKSRGLSVPDQSLHMVFTGNPGTGKTTIARLVAKIYKSLGVLSQGQFVETDRSDLVAGYLGQTAIKTREVVEKALGGVLFIDEAYSLTISEAGRDEFGYEVVNTLLKLMEDHREGMVVIVAGYTEPMQKFIRSNPGLQSRFNKFLHFDDYAPAELTEIFQNFAAQNDYQLHPATMLKLDNVFTTLYAQRDEMFGNARLARNLFEKAINNHANRMVSVSVPDEASLVTLYPEDIPNA